LLREWGWGGEKVTIRGNTDTSARETTKKGTKQHNKKRKKAKKGHGCFDRKDLVRERKKCEEK